MTKIQVLLLVTKRSTTKQKVHFLVVVKTLTYLAPAGTSSNGETNPAVLNDSSPGDYTADGGMTTGTAEALGDGTSGNGFAQMAFSIETTVEAKSRALKLSTLWNLLKTLKQFMV